MSVEIIHGDCSVVVEMLASNSIHSIITDPPYALVSIGKRFGKPSSVPARAGVYARTGRGFMGKTWDNGGVAFDPNFWVEALRVLRPGGHVLAFGGTRTYHHIAMAIDDAGFEIRDQIGWAYGSGFPKSHNQFGEWNGWGTALKPAWEPIVVARKPLDGTVMENLTRWGVGALNIDGCRVPSESGLVGRWPANLVHDGSDEVLAAFPPARGQIARASSSSQTRKTQHVYGAMKRGSDGSVPRDTGGSAARFFYCAKASRADRDDGLVGFEKLPLLWSAGTKNPGSFQSAGTEKAARNPHPTVKPTELMRWLCRLVTPPGGTVLDPFMGSGSTGRGALLEGFAFVGIEMEPDYVDIARARIAAVSRDGGGVFA